jgi:predicted peroxiredoxin
MAKLVVSITHAEDNKDKATIGMVVANAGLVSGRETIAFLSSEGVRLAVRGYADDLHEEGFAPMKELLDAFTENGGTVWVCAPCFKKRNLPEDGLIANCTIVGGAKLVEFLSQGAACISY